MKRKRVLLLVLFTSIVCCGLVVFVAYCIDKVLEDIVPKGIKVCNIEIGNLTREQAYKKLSKLKFEIVNKPVYIKYHKKMWKFSLGELGVEIDFDDTINAAFAVVRADTLIERLILRYNVARNSYNVHAGIKIDKKSLINFNIRKLNKKDSMDILCILKE